MAIDEKKVREFLRLRGEYLYHRESQELEFKEQFNFGGLAEYFRDFAAFANNRGGYLIFGVQNSPRVPIGLSDSALEQFEKVDPERITGFLLDIFSPDVMWDQALVEFHDASFGVFRVYEAAKKPVIAKKDQGKDQEIRNGDVYYRYGGRTQCIQYPELEAIIDYRIEENNRQWQDLVQRIGRTGPHNAAILDVEKSRIELGGGHVLTVDEEVARKLRSARDKGLSEEDKEADLKLVGDLVPREHVSVVIWENRLDRYPLSAMELARVVKERLPYVAYRDVWRAIKENRVKDNEDYSVYNFRNKRHEDEYEESGHVQRGTPSIYNQNAVEFLTEILKQDS